MYGPGGNVTLSTAAIGSAAGDPAPRKPRRSFTADQKAANLRHHHVDKVPVSQLVDENALQPSFFYYWQKQLFENAATALQPQAPVAPSRALEAKVEAREKQVAKEDAVIARVTEEHVKPIKHLGSPEWFGLGPR